MASAALHRVGVARWLGDSLELDRLRTTVAAVAAVADHWADSLARGGGEEGRNKDMEISICNDSSCSKHNRFSLLIRQG